MSTEGAKPQKRWPAPICRSSRSSRLRVSYQYRDGDKASREEREAAKETVSIHPDFA